MSERVGTAKIINRHTDDTGAAVSPAAGPGTAEPDLATADLLVEEVSIDGMCGVY